MKIKDGVFTVSQGQISKLLIRTLYPILNLYYHILKQELAVKSNLKDFSSEVGSSSSCDQSPVSSRHVPLSTLAEHSTQSEYEHVLRNILIRRTFTKSIQAENAQNLRNMADTVFIMLTRIQEYDPTINTRINVGTDALEIPSKL